MRITPRAIEQFRSNLDRGRQGRGHSVPLRLLVSDFIFALCASDIISRIVSRFLHFSVREIAEVLNLEFDIVSMNSNISDIAHGCLLGTAAGWFLICHYRRTGTVRVNKTITVRSWSRNLSWRQGAPSSATMGPAWPRCSAKTICRIALGYLAIGLLILLGVTVVIQFYFADGRLDQDQVAWIFDSSYVHTSCGYMWGFLMTNFLGCRLLLPEDE